MNSSDFSLENTYTSVMRSREIMLLYGKYLRFYSKWKKDGSNCTYIVIAIIWKMYGENDWKALITFSNVYMCQVLYKAWIIPFNPYQKTLWGNFYPRLTRMDEKTEADRSYRNLPKMTFVDNGRNWKRILVTSVLENRGCVAGCGVMCTFPPPFNLFSKFCGVTILNLNNFKMCIRNQNS